jgi:predicted phosphodiesterase
MRIGIISDIHSNVEALTESQSLIQKTQPTRLQQIWY